MAEEEMAVVSDKERSPTCNEVPCGVVVALLPTDIGACWMGARLAVTNELANELATWPLGARYLTPLLVPPLPPGSPLTKLYGTNAVCVE